ncbi:MAG: aminoglycoside phosphotransferase family protein [Patescibacteria group bacterium]
MEDTIKKYFQDKFRSGGNVFSVEFLTNGNSSNHLNYKVTTSSGLYVARITKPGDLLSYSNLADEYTILKMVEDFYIGPHAVSIDLEYFDSPILIEEYIDGISFAELKSPDEEIFKNVISLLNQTSKVNIRSEQFPFKCTYTTYKTNFKVWDFRMKEIEKLLGEDHFIIQEFRVILKKAEDILKEKDGLLQNSQKEFIYNDVHPGNIFWMNKEKKAKFIDWQKVSLGDPTFMIALFARRFNYIWNEEKASFSNRVLEFYSKEKQINNIEELFYARCLERAVSDMIWIVWADIKNGVKPKISIIEENKYYSEACLLISKIFK